MTPSGTVEDLRRHERQRQEEEHDAPSGVADAGGPALPGEDPDDQAPEDVVQLSITGDADLRISPGGRKPDQATVTIRGGEIELASGAFEMGQRLAIVVEGIVDEETTRNLRDRKTGQLTGTKRKFALITDRVAKVPLGTGDGSAE